ncbi:MAG: trehalase family glycosidase [Sodaliphilus pleomorphus]|uniref:MGH1-like glycoside hydrolase domain-containing protein n=1 Tax=Sodaliphilus pleomorphus TaxID=2606626 RepID=UPI00240A4C9A|nr:trehalase family glycosidase [Sodaliphilus pleomorphus]MDD6474546.1 trehalase family glycosidase [Sodaliphilus pleomorphus]
MKHITHALLIATVLAPVLAGAQNLISSGSPLYKLPYKDTYVREPLVAENSFRIAKVQKTVPGTFAQARKVLPNPYWEGHDKEIEMYWKAWEIGIKNINQPLDDSGFITSYIAPAYNGNIFMWDDSFITMFCRYGQRFFPFQRTLDNFYAKQHPDGFICREIRADGSDCFGRYDPTSTGPNLMPWSEWLYYTQFGDDNRLNKVFPVLAAYYKWLKLNHTWRNGTYWSSGWGTGMDNMPRVPEGYNTIYSNGHMIWLDTNLQEIMVANILLKMGFYLERWQEIETFEDDIKHLTKYINDNMWNDKDGFLYDQYADGSLSTTMGIYAYWALHTDVLPKSRLDRLVAHLADTATFNRHHRVPSLAANNPKYKANGRYWVGGVWPGTNYMVISGLVDKGYRDLAWDITLNDYNNVLDVYKKTGTFWEYYAPESSDPGFMARKDFVGWTGLPPIAELIEYIFGVRANLPENHITIDVHLTDAYGIDRYPYGEKGDVSFKVAKRASTAEKPKVTIKTNVPFKVTLMWGDKKLDTEVKAGTNTI